MLQVRVKIWRWNLIVLTRASAHAATYLPPLHSGRVWSNVGLLKSMQNQLPNKWPNCREHFSYSAPCRHKLKMLLHHAAMQELVNRRLIIFIEHIAYGHCRSKRSIGIIMAFYTKALICYSSLLDWLAVNVEFTCLHTMCCACISLLHITGVNVYTLSYSQSLITPGCGLGAIVWAATQRT